MRDNKSKVKAQKAKGKSRQLREVLLSDPVSAWLEGIGCTVYAEAPNRTTSVDLVGARADMLVAVELKTTLSAKVRHSAYMNKLFAECSFCAVPTRPSKGALDDCRAKGVGVLHVREGMVSVVLPSSHGEMLFGGEQSAMRRKLAVLEPGGRGGSPCLLGVGPAQEILCAVDAYRAGHPRATWREVFENVPNHYSSPKSMAQSLGEARARREQNDTANLTTHEGTEHMPQPKPNATATPLTMETMRKAFDAFRVEEPPLIGGQVLQRPDVAYVCDGDLPAHTVVVPPNIFCELKAAARAMDDDVRPPQPGFTPWGIAIRVDPTLPPGRIKADRWTFWSMWKDAVSTSYYTLLNPTRRIRSTSKIPIED